MRALLYATLMLAGFVVAPTADAAPVSRCTASEGTVVAVDFARWGGPVVRGCDTSRPKTGAQLLTNAGFRMTGTQHDGPAFVCRIGNAAYDSGTRYPMAADDPCVLTPPATAYWSYWLAAPGANRWTYSNWGAYAPQSEPEPGGVELWIFGGTRTEGSDATPVSGFPVCSPNSLRAGGSPSRCTPKAAVPKPRRDRPREERATRAPKPERERDEPSRSATARPRTTSAAARPARSLTTPSARTLPTAAPVLRTTAPESSAAAVVDARPASDDADDAGSALPLVVGVGLAAVLAAGGGAAAWRRRRAAE